MIDTVGQARGKLTSQWRREGVNDAMRWQLEASGTVTKKCGCAYVKRKGRVVRAYIGDSA
jgi:hypothetical protein